MSKFWQKTQRRLHWLKKIVPEPAQPRRQILLAVMGKCAAYDGQPTGSAIGLRVVLLAPVGVALSWAGGTVGQSLHGFASPVVKLTVFEQVQVAWPRGRHHGYSTSTKA